jgi:hypothetical protein
LCGNYDDDLPSVLYSTEKVCDDLTKCFLVQEEMMQRCKESQLGKSIPSTLKRLPLCVDKLPKKRKFGVKECVLKNIVEGDDGGVSIKEYNKLLKKIDRLKIEEVDEVNPDVSKKDTCKNISDALNKRKDTNIGIFLASIDINKKYKKEEIEKLLKDAKYQCPSKFFRAITRQDSSYGPGQIFESIGSRWEVLSNCKKAWIN